MSYATVHKEITLYTNVNTHRYNLTKTNEVFEGEFMIEILAKRGIYSYDDTFTVTLAFTAPIIMTNADLTKPYASISTQVMRAYKSDGKSSLVQAIEYELSEVEQELVNKAIFIALQGYPTIKPVVTVDNAPAMIVENIKTKLADRKNKKVITFIDIDTDQDSIERYDDSANGHLTVIAHNKYQFVVEFNAVIEEETKPAKYSDGICVRERVEQIISIDVTDLRVASETGHQYDGDITDITSYEVVDYTVDDETRELIKLAIIEDIKATPKN